ncbi:MAG: hypothetical protein K0Q49_2086 [Haloplasmataceae bacterium]|nr:hypothetical protein [Haloplasmataceae bacterium]
MVQWFKPYQHQNIHYYKHLEQIKKLNQEIMNCPVLVVMLKQKIPIEFFWAYLGEGAHKLLQSAGNYHYCDASFESILTTFGSGLLEFFLDGNMMLPADPIDGPAVVLLNFV